MSKKDLVKEEASVRESMRRWLYSKGSAMKQGLRNFSLDSNSDDYVFMRIGKKYKTHGGFDGEKPEWRFKRKMQRKLKRAYETELISRLIEEEFMQEIS